MHLPFLPLLALLLAPSGIQACIRVHTELKAQPLGGDSMVVKIFDNDFYYEKQSQSKPPFSTSDKTKWVFNFNHGYHVDIWDNGRAGHIWLDNGWAADLRLIDSHFESYCEAQTDNGRCLSHVTTWTQCLNDNFGNCGSYVCGL